jgi:hypothetical protein
MTFELASALTDDIEEMARSWQSSLQSYDIWQASMRDVSREDELAFYVEALELRSKKPGTVFTKLLTVKRSK